MTTRGTGLRGGGEWGGGGGGGFRPIEYRLVTMTSGPQDPYVYTMFYRNSGRVQRIMTTRGTGHGGGGGLQTYRLVTMASRQQEPCLCLYNVL